MLHHEPASDQNSLQARTVSPPYDRGAGAGPGPGSASGTRPVSLTAIVRKRRTVLEASAIRLPPGSCVGVVGRNGAGKSSLLLALAGLLRRGRVADWGDRGTPVTTALVPQHPGFPKGVRIRSILHASGVTVDDLDRHAPGLVPADLIDARSGRLSAGQRQRISAAMALARNDPLVLLDEPYSSLDVPGRLALRRAMEERRSRQRGVTIVVAAHAPADLFGGCDSIIALRDGGVTQLPTDRIAPSPGGGLPAFETALAAILEGRI